MRVDLFLVCRGCQKRHQNYRTSKAKKLQGEKLNLKKYCKYCQKTVAHKEETIGGKKKETKK